MQQLSVLVENRPGALAAMADALKEANVNVQAIMLEGSLDFGVARIQVDGVNAARRALTTAGFQVTVGDVLVLDLPNRPGELARVCHLLAEADINVDYIFGTASSADGASELVVKVDDAVAARDALGL